MNDASGLLRQLEAAGIELWVEGETLRFRAPAGALGPVQRAALEQHKAGVLSLLRARAQHASELAPLSWNQRALWFLQQVTPSSAAYNVPFVTRISTLVDVDALGQALQAIVDRHAMLRMSVVVEDGEPHQHIRGSVAATLERVEVTGLTDAALLERVALNFQRPFDLARGPMLRTTLFTRGPADHILLLVAHHMAMDGWSVYLMGGELGALYGELTGGPAASLPAVSARYTDYDRWQREMLAGPRGQVLRQFWKSNLSEPRAMLEMPLDFPRPARKSYRGATEALDLGPDLTEAVKSFARNAGTTPFVVLLAAFKLLLFRYTGTGDLIVGTPTLGRPNEDFARVIGDFAGIIPLRTRVEAGLSFHDLVSRVREVVLQGLDAQEYPFPLIVEQLNPERDASRSPLVETMFAMEGFDGAVRRAVGGEGGPVALAQETIALDTRSARFDLVLQLSQKADRIDGVVEYSTDLYRPETARQWASHFCALLRSALDAPDEPIGRLEFQLPAERAQLAAWNATDVERPADVLHRILEGRVPERRDRVAVSAGSATLTYDELNTAANRAARLLVRQGVTRGSIVGISLERTPALLVALLAVQKAGGTYLPLDPAFPAERLTYMLADSGATVLLAGEAGLAGLALPPGVRMLEWPALAGAMRQEPGEDFTTAAGPDDAAYLIYTSGSTGRPKGVAISHGSLVNFLWSMRQVPGITEADVLAAVTTLSFDIAGLELYLPLLAGARVELVSREDAADGAALAARLDACQATMMQATPSTWRMLVEAGWQGRPGFRALSGGEALPPDLARTLTGRVAELWNLYGPTETTIWSTCERVNPDDITIGKPIANTVVHVLDGEGQVAPIGVPGELCIGGDGVAIGYHNRPDLDAEKFVADPTGRPGRVYRTGDLGRWRADGRLQCVGRLDQQVKVRGYRIEPGEIEARLARHPAIRASAVAAREVAPGDARLVAYVVYHIGESPTVSELRRFLRHELPDYMVPALIVPLDVLPLTANGKVDRKALPDPYRSTVQRSTSPTPPAEGAERDLADVWEEVLQVRQVGADDNFFDLGGHSLLALRATALFEKRTGMRLDPRAFFFQSLRQIVAGLPSGAGVRA